jgi:hypothetical protein
MTLLDLTGRTLARYTLAGKPSCAACPWAGGGPHAAATASGIGKWPEASLNFYPYSFPSVMLI